TTVGATSAHVPPLWRQNLRGTPSAVQKSNWAFVPTGVVTVTNNVLVGFSARPEAPVIVRVYCPAATLTPTLTLIVDVLAGIGFGLKVTSIPLGCPVEDGVM